jgi:AraC-like DNA-binding protein
MPNNLRYDYVGHSWLLEGADWIGRRPDGLELHYHDEVQVSVVWNGHRDFRVGRHPLRLAPGQMLLVPQRRAHRALPSLRGELRSTEFFLQPESLPAATRQMLVASDYLVADEPTLLLAQPDDVGDMIAGWVRDGAPPPRWRGPRARTGIDSELLDAATRYASITEAARALSCSREGFIRAFARHAGMTPHAYRINERLNRGRDLLRRRESISDTAYAAGFSDQSHFGRLFLRYFGATPGQFRAAHAPT